MHDAWSCRATGITARIRGAVRPFARHLCHSGATRPVARRRLTWVDNSDDERVAKQYDVHLSGIPIATRVPLDGVLVIPAVYVHPQACQSFESRIVRALTDCTSSVRRPPSH